MSRVNLKSCEKGLGKDLKGLNGENVATLGSQQVSRGLKDTSNSGEDTIRHEDNQSKDN